MEEQPIAAPYDKRLEFLYAVIEAADSRREAVESKASIILASVPILLGALGLIGVQPQSASVSVVGGGLAANLLNLALIAITFASVCALWVLAPFGSLRRRWVMRASEHEYNLFWCGKIANYENSEAYLSEIRSLTEPNVLEQLGLQAYNLSRLTMNRYKWFHRSLIALIISMLLVIIMAAFAL